MFIKTSDMFRNAALGLILCAATLSASHAEEARVAVAANFTLAAEDLAKAFKAETGHEATLIFASTGKHYAQIANGAPFDVFLAADVARPEKAVAEGLAVPGSQFTYAVGQIVLFSADPTRVDTDGAVLKSGDFDKIAITNPETAPYGAAAVEAMTALGVYDRLSPLLVQGDNVTQTLQFITTGNAELGFVALSQVIGETGGSKWLVPTDLYAPIRQDAVLLTHGADNPAAAAFLDFLKSDTAHEIIVGYGYGTE